LPLRPELKKYENYETNVSTLKLKKDNYVKVAEQAPEVICDNLFTAPTQASMYSYAMSKKNQYTGRLNPDENPVNVVDLIPPIPFSIMPTLNANF
jgi:hypothetical protein